MHTGRQSPRIAEAARRLLQDDLERLIAISTRELLRAEPSYTSMGHNTLEEQMRKNIKLTLLRLTGDHISPELAAAPYETGQIRAFQGVDLIAVSTSFRIDLRILWQAFLEDAKRHITEDYDRYIAELLQVWEAVERNITEMTLGYRTAAERLEQQNTELKRAAFQRLLTLGDSSTIEGLSRQVATLGLDPGGPLYCLASDLPESQVSELSRSQARLEKEGIAHYFGWHDRSLIGFLQITDPEAVDTADFESALRELRERTTGLAFVRNVAGIPDAVRNAQLLVASADSPGIRSLHDNWLETFIQAEPTLADALAEEIFAAFEELSDYAREELTRVIDGYFATNGSIAAIGEVTFRHRNTVRNRLAQIEELTGLDLSSPRDTALLALAFHSWKRRSQRGHS